MCIRGFISSSVPLKNFEKKKNILANLLRRERENFAAKEDCLFSILNLAMKCTKRAD